MLKQSRLVFVLAGMLCFPLYTMAAAPVADADQDGVADSRDQCPDTQLGLIVDEHGCPLDEDKDGVPDYLDQCPQTPPGTPVDAQGCARMVEKEAELDALRGMPLQELAAQPAAARAMPGMSFFAPPSPPPMPLVNRENYAHFSDNPLKQTAQEPVSTFSIDVDTGAYANTRRMLKQGYMPPKDAVRVEEMINYFAYQYPQPHRQQAFSVHTALAPAPWNPHTHLLRIGIQGADSDKNHLPPANLVFLLDVSGSMNSPDKLPLLKASLKLLSRQLDADDKVSIAVYAGAAGVVLEPTPGNQTATIEAALNRLQAGGSTNGGEGIELAYSLAQQAFIKGGINRVLLATDGDFNVGTVDFEALKNLIESKRKSGIGLSTLGFGTGNYNDQLMEQLADAGNGNYAYIDTLNEAQKVLVDQVSSTLHTIARDVKIQIEFNPRQVAEYRLIGYENRQLQREDFDNDKVDAGDIGAGHQVTALYELALVGRGGERLGELRYQDAKEAKTDLHGNELAFLRLRYKQPEAEQSRLLEQPILADSEIKLEQTDADFRFAAAVAAFGQLLRGAKYLQEFSYADVLQLAQQGRGKDDYGYRGEFVQLVKLAQSLSAQ